MTTKQLRERLDGPITENSTISLRLFISGLVATASLVGAYIDLRVQVHQQSELLQAINQKLIDVSTVAWTRQEDFYFMSDFAEKNKLTMIRHSGEK